MDKSRLYAYIYERARERSLNINTHKIRLHIDEKVVTRGSEGPDPIFSLRANSLIEHKYHG